MTKRALLKDENLFFNLFEDREATGDQIDPLFDSSKSQIMMWIKMADIRPNPHQPRSNFDSLKLKELAESIRQKGLLQAITVRQKGNFFEIIAGERRYRACKMLGMREIPAMVRNDVDDLGTLEIALIENLQREDLTPLEEALIYSRMLKELKYTQDQLSRTLSKSQQYINDRLQLLNLSPTIQNKIQESRLSLSKARKIATIKDHELQEKISRRVLEDGLNARQTEELVKIAKIKSPTHLPKKKAPVLTRLSRLTVQIMSILESEEFRDMEPGEQEKARDILGEFHLQVRELFV